jgi:DNA integrity scanning protein DisA with diadenylate cyclase activity
MNLTTMLAHVARTLPYRDIIEVLFFAGAIYYIQLWLKKDSQRNLLLGFYMYCALFCASYYADLPVLRFILFVFAPAIAMLFIILHEETLQKNFITLSNPAVPFREQTTWVEELIKCSLTALNKHKDIILVLERNDPLKNLIHAPYFIYAELKKDVFEILLEKQAPGNDYMIWINQQGKIVSINSSWKTQLDEEWISQEVEHLHVWKQQALYISSKTDTIALKINPISRSFDLVSQGRIIEGMTSEALTLYLKKQLLQSTKKESAPVLQPVSQKSL